MKAKLEIKVVKNESIVTGKEKRYLIIKGYSETIVVTIGEKAFKQIENAINESNSVIHQE